MSCIQRGITIGVFGSVLAVMHYSAFASNANTIGVADASLEASFYSDASCMLTIDKFVQYGKTAIDADVGDEGMRMLIHCDTEDGRRLTLLARGDTLNVSQRADLLDRDRVAAGDPGMIAWLTRSGVKFADDTAPRRHVIGGSVKLRKSPPAHTLGAATNAGKQSFASINGVLESIIKSDDQGNQQTSETEQEINAEQSIDLEADTLESSIAKPPTGSNTSPDSKT